MNTTLRRADEAERLAHDLLRFAAELRASGDGTDVAFSGDDQDDNHLNVIATKRSISAARRLYDARRKRCDFFPPELFGEPAWDMLLELYVAFGSDRDTTMGNLAIASQAPLSTAQRWIGILEARGLLERHRSEHDARVQFVHLSRSAARTMRKYLLSNGE